MASFVSLDNGCWHVQKEWFLFTGKFERPPPQLRLKKCGSQCPNCTGDWHKIHLPIYRSSVVEFFTSAHGAKCLPCVLGNGKTLTQRIKSSPYWLEMIFDRAASGIKTTHIDALLLSLASANILTIERVHDEDRWCVMRTVAESGTPNYLRSEVWTGVNLHDEQRTRRRDASLIWKKKTSTAEKSIVDDKNIEEDSDDDEIMGSTGSDSEDED